MPGMMQNKQATIYAVLLMLGFVRSSANTQAQEHHQSEDEHEASSNPFHLATYRTWFLRSFLPDAIVENSYHLNVSNSWLIGNK